MAHRKGDAGVFCDIEETSPRGILTTPPSNPEASGVTLPPSDVSGKEGQTLQSTALEKPVQVCPNKFPSIKALRTHPETSIEKSFCRYK